MPRSDDDTGLARQRLEVEIAELELLPYYDVEAAQDLALRLEHEAIALDAVDLQLRIQTVRGDVLLRKGKTSAGGRLVLEVNRWATAQHHNHLLCRTHRLLCTFFDRIGDYAAALEHAVRAVELTSDSQPARMRVGHIMGLAAALARTGSWDLARERYRTAEEIAAPFGDVDLRLHLLNDLSWLEHDAGNLDRSLEIAQRMQAYAAAHGVPLPASALDTVARAQMGLGRYADAERTMQAVTEAGEAVLEEEDFDGLAEALLTVAEIQRMQGRIADARATLQRCLRLCDQGDLVSVRVYVRLEQAELAAADGNYREAFELYKVFHAEAESLVSAESDARARTLQAAFETTEARREGQRFREMSLRDPLTGLHNRRYVDDELPSLIRQSIDDDSALTVALVDLDFFKVVNDTLSHDVGDEVLRRVAAILVATVPDAGFIARMGGEEFLLVLPLLAPAEANALLEQVRAAIAMHPWPELTAAVPVTVSIGATRVRPDRATPAALLGHADRNLYAAKHAGRNRVVSTTI